MSYTPAGLYGGNGGRAGRGRGRFIYVAPFIHGRDSKCFTYDKVLKPHPCGDVYRSHGTVLDMNSDLCGLCWLTMAFAVSLRKTSQSVWGTS